MNGFARVGYAVLSAARIRLARIVTKLAGGLMTAAEGVSANFGENHEVLRR